MARVKRGLVTKRKHNKLLDSTKGFRGTKSKLVRVAKEAALHAGQYAYHGRKRKKRDFRRLWNTRIGEAAKQEGLSYSTLMNKLRKSQISLDRKVLSELIVSDLPTFQRIVETVRNV